MSEQDHESARRRHRTGRPARRRTRLGGVGPVGRVGRLGHSDGDGGGGITDLVEQPAKVMRIGSMIRQLLEEVRSAPLDDASRIRLKEIHAASIKELETGLAPELVEELERLSLPFTEDATPSDAELRIAQAQLVGWLEGLFHGIQTAIYAQQMAARAQFEQMRRALPPGAPRPDGARRARAAGPGRLRRHVPLTSQALPCTSQALQCPGSAAIPGAPGIPGAGGAYARRRPRQATNTSPSTPTITRATPGAATRCTSAGASATVVKVASTGGGGTAARPPPSRRLDPGDVRRRGRSGAAARGRS